MGPKEKAADGIPLDEKRPDHGELSVQQSSASGSTVTPSEGKKEKAKASTPSADSGDSEDVFAHLPEDEKQILKKQLDAPDVKVSFVTLFRYASRMDLIIMVVSAFCAIVAGAALPLFTVSNLVPFV